MSRQTHEHNTAAVPPADPWIWAGEAFWVGFGMIASILALLAGTRFLTYLLSTGEYGRLALAVSLATLAVQVFGEPIGKTAVRFYAYWRGAGMPSGFIRRLTTSFLKACAWIALLGGAGAAICLSMPWFPGMDHVVLTGVFAVFLVFNRVALALEDAARKRWFRSMMQGGFEAGRFLFAVGLVILMATPDAATVLMGFVLAGGVAAFVHILYLRRLLDLVRNKVLGPVIPAGEMDIRAMRAFHLPLIVSNSGVWVVMMADRWMLTCFGSSGDVGGYSAVYQLAFIPMLIVGNFLLLLLEPILYQMAGLDKRNASSLQVMRINHYAALCILIFSVVGFVLFFFGHPFLGRMLLGTDFRAYSWLFPWLILAGGCFASAQQLLLKLSCDMRTDLLARVWALVAIIAVTAYGIGAGFWQMKGVLVAVVAVNLTLLIFSLGIAVKSRP